MLPVSPGTDPLELLKLLNEMDECRSEYDHAVASNKTQLAADLLSKYRALANLIDQQAHRNELHRSNGRQIQHQQGD